MHLSIERRMLFGFGLVVILLLSISGISFQVSVRLRELNRWVEHTHQAQAQIQDVLAFVTKARSGERGFLITGDTHFIDTPANDLANIDRKIDTLQRLTADNPVQQANVVQLRIYVAAGMKVVEQVIALRKQEQIEAARQIISSKQARTVRESITQCGAAMEQEEDRLLTQRRLAVETYQQSTHRLFIFIGFLMLLSLSVVYRGVRATHRRTVTTLESISDAFFALDSNWNFTYVNTQAESLLEKRRTELLGKNIWKMFPGAEETVFGQQYHRAFKEKVSQRFEAFYPPLNRWFEVMTYPSSEGISVYFHDITERKRAEQQVETTNLQLEHQILHVNEQAAELERQKAELKASNRRLTALAITDGLTGLYNHRAFQEEFAHEFERTKRNNTPLSILLLDVDKFKTYNDMFGHPQGDEVLKTVAKILQEVARDTDYICRYGGEEFVIILPNIGAQGAIITAERFRAAIEQHPWTLRPVTASLGIATLDADQTAAQELIVQADKALYDSKVRGRNCVTHFVDIVILQGLDELAGNTSQPYSDIVREMLQIQQNTLASASEQMREMLANAYNATILSWSRLLHMKDKETEGHSERVTEMMVRLARSIGMNEEEAMYARWGALLHDVGKMSIPDSILHKPGPLTEDEWEIMRQHTTVAYEMLSPISFLRPALDIPYCHHEKWDGTGYPRGLKGEEIPLTARLFAVIDVYDALTTDRPYREAWSQEKTLAHLQSLSGTHFDPRAVNVFMAMLSETALHFAEAPDRLAA
jgi:diguanylate cyclase (GGDEF)-like protein/PAS domain S-box-containing protein/putative nucleotidyltransferase with HDIG domain